MGGKAKVIVGLSGGVDSAVAAARLLDSGFAVEGLFMKNWEDDDEPGYCAAREDLEMAAEVARILEIPLHKANYAAEYWERVFSRFLHEYETGRTPNPDVLCNREIKFPALIAHARRLGATFVATGHYARVEHSKGSARLLRSADEAKDQTYFLHALHQENLEMALFPLGESLKENVRREAQALGLPNHARKDSTGICFIGERRFRDFLARYLRAPDGDIVTPEGQVIGRHRGLMFYTLGQREGLGVGGVADAREAAWYVVGKDPESNRLIAAQGTDHPLLFSNALRTEEPHWILQAPEPGEPLLARIRHRQPLQPAWIERADPAGLDVRFRDPQRAVTPGQSIVFYREAECVGGAVISQRV